jgi:hypothetical protein
MPPRHLATVRTFTPATDADPLARHVGERIPQAVIK